MFKKGSLARRLILIYTLIILILGGGISWLGIYFISRDITREAQRQIQSDLRSAWAVFNAEKNKIQTITSLLARQENIIKFIDLMAGKKQIPEGFEKHYHRLQFDLEKNRRKFGLDFLTVADKDLMVQLRTSSPYLRGDFLSFDPVINSALNGTPTSGVEIWPQERIEKESTELAERARILLKPTPYAVPRDDKEETRAMLIIASAPIRDEQGKIVGVLYGGELLNRNFQLVDRIRDIVYQGKIYAGKPLGTVTIFLWDVRIATNVLLENGNRAIGTRVSRAVYENVLENGKSWLDRAFVVNDWYISAYEPIRDFEGKVVGIFYAGILEKKYKDLEKQVLLSFGIAVLVGLIIVWLASFFFAYSIALPLKRLNLAVERFAQGELEQRVEVKGYATREISELAGAFNQMAEALAKREWELEEANRELAETNEKLKEVNRNYMEMIGFVTHELKAPLASALMAVGSLKQGLLGELDPLQLKMVDKIEKSLNYFNDMIKNYLSLSRIEKGELEVKKDWWRLREDIIEPVLSQLENQAKEKRMKINIEVPENLPIFADLNLLRIVYDNLLSNAIKYGREGGEIRCGYEKKDEEIKLNVWNEGEGVRPEEAKVLFEKFSRLERRAGKKTGTGLGLYITKTIVEKHGGRIWVESKFGEWIDFIFVLPQPEEGGNGEDSSTDS